MTISEEGFSIYEPEESFLYYLSTAKNLDKFYYQLSVDGYMNTFFNSQQNSIDGYGAYSLNNKDALPKTINNELFTEENYKFLGVKTVNFDYNLNKYRFRSEEFSTFNSKNINILTIGCSNSVGIGIPNECTWSELLKEKIFLNNDKEVHIYNLSVSGGNIRLLIKNIITFINTVGCPNYIFALFPDSTRYILFDKNLMRYFNYTWFVSDNLPESKKEEISLKHNQYSITYQNEYKHENNLFDTILYIHLLESMCNLYNINFKWGSWHSGDNEIYKNISFKNYIEFKNINDFYVPLDYFHTLSKLNKIAVMQNKELLDKKNINDKPFWVIGSDLAHPGTYWHEQVANIFFESIKDLK